MKQTRLLPLLIALLLCPFILAAQQVNESKAASAAHAFLGKQATLSSSALRSATESPAYYIFNADDNKGYVIISGDEHLRPVLGYATEGSFDYDQLPPTMRSWLQSYQDQIEQIREAQLPVAPEIEKEWAALLSPTMRSFSLLSESMEVVLPTANWGQWDPYNKYAPDNNPIGCVATAMAIIMKYHQWPEQGSGSHAYTWGKHTHSVDFNVNYAWNKMPDQMPEGGYSTEQGEAIATLMYHSAVAVEAMFGEVETGAYNYNVMPAFKNYFGYDKGIKTRYRLSMFKTQWINLIKNEINNNRPIYYAGNSSTGGHAFVVDGYNEQNYVHINWGWDGANNNFFAIDLLAPYGDSVNYSNNEEMIFTIGKPGIKELSYSSLTLTSYNESKGLEINVEDVEKEKPFTVKAATIYNATEQPFNGQIGIALTDKTGEIKEILASSDIRVESKQTMAKQSFSCQVKSATIDPTDLLYPVTSIDKRASWQIVNGNDVVSFLSVKGNDTTGKYEDDDVEDFPEEELGFDEKGQFKVNAGRLAELLWREQELPKKLTLVGTLNADDFDYIPGIHQLEELDMLQVTIRASDDNEAHTLPKQALQSATALKKLILPANLKTIGTYAICNCSSLTSIDFPNSLTTLMQGCFSESGLEGVLRLPDNVETIEYAVFADNCLEAFTITPENPYFKTEEGILYSKDGTMIYLLPSRINKREIRIPDTVKELDVCTFWNLDLDVLDLSALQLSHPLYAGLFTAAKIKELYLPSAFGMDNQVFNAIGRESPDIQIIYHTADKKPGILYSGHTRFNEIDDNDVIYTSILIIPDGTREIFEQAPGWKDFRFMYEESEALTPQVVNRTAPRVSVIDQQLIHPKFVFMNAGGEEIKKTTVKVSYQGKEETQLFVQKIGTNESFNFVLDQPIESVAGESTPYIITMECDNGFSAQIEGVVRHPATHYSRRFVAEMLVATWCGYSVSAIDGAQRIGEKYGDSFIPIMVHIGDIMVDSYYAESLNLDNTPSGRFNRSETVHGTYFSWLDHHLKQEQFQKSFAGVSLKGEFTSPTKEKITATVRTTFSYSFTDEEYRYAFVLVENNVAVDDPAYDQANFTSGQIVYEEKQFETMPPIISSIDLPHQHVARALFEYHGIEGSVPRKVKNGVPVEYSYTFDLPESVLNKNEIEVIALLIDCKTGEIINAARTPLNGKFTSIEEITEPESNITIAFLQDVLYMNSDNGIAHLTIHSTGGQLMQAIDNPSNSLDLSGYHPGVYFLSVTDKQGNRQQFKLLKR
ncbi:C10 family peptidase [Parabacteroides sp. OttesenSCG-928-N08]|nr:C10 family peptidase [Parabacteroides sp. OttesenSCG-928-N08]